MGAAIIPAVIGAAASIGGSLMQSNAQQAAVEAQNREQQAAMQRTKRLREQEDARQEEMRLRQQAEVDKSLENQDVESVTDQLDDTKAERSATGEKLTTEMAALTPGEVAVASRPGQAGDVQVVNDDLGTRLAQAARTTRGYLQAKSDIGAYGELFGDRARQLGLTNEELNFMNKKREGSLRTAQVQGDFLGQNFGSSIVPNSTSMALGSALSGIGGMFSKGVGGGYG